MPAGEVLDFVEKRRLQRAVEVAEEISGLAFSVYVGPGEVPVRRRHRRWQHDHPRHQVPPVDLVARVLLDPGDVVLMELPSYTGAISAFRNVGASLVGVRQAPDGIDLDNLDEVYDRERRAGRSGSGAAS